jgi:tetratricopeptide (TPR) repeat protein
LSRIKDIRRQLEAVVEAIDDLDDELAGGGVTPEEHARRCAERERDAGRLFVTLRRAQREARELDARRPAGGPAARGLVTEAPDAAGTAWLRSPVALASAAILLVVIGVGAGVGVGRWLTGSRAASAGASMPAGTPPSAMSEIELQALRQAAAREDAPIPSLLQFAHLALDQGRLDEARGVYQRVLAREPRNAEAVTHLGAVLFQQGRVDEALAKVQEALAIDPRYIHALWDRTQYLYHSKRDWAGTVRAGEAFLKVSPEGPDADNIRKMMAEARQQAAGGGTSGTR